MTRCSWYVDGAVELSRDGDVLHTAKQNEVLGAWALFDDVPDAVHGKNGGRYTLLRIGRDDFYDPSVRQRVRLPPPFFQPSSSASASCGRAMTRHVIMV
jgi:hypothetical protein